MGFQQLRSGGIGGPSGDGGRRGQSESIGVLLLAAVVLVLGAAVAQFVFGIDIIQNREQAVGPQVSFDTTVQDGGDLVIEHQSGNTVETDALTVVGSEGGTLCDSDCIDGQVGPEWTASESITLDDTDLSPGETVRIIWEAPQNDDSTVILRYEYRP